MRARLRLCLVAIGAALSCAPPPPVPDRPTGVPSADFAHAVELQRQGQHWKSVAYFRAAAEADPQRSLLHIELGKALHNATREMGFSGHGVRFAVATSQQRARLRDEALAEMQRAIDLEPDPQQRAAMWAIRARALELYGYVADARVGAGQALALQPAGPYLRSWIAELDRRLRTGR